MKSLEEVGADEKCLAGRSSVNAALVIIAESSSRNYLTAIFPHKYPLTLSSRKFIYTLHYYQQHYSESCEIETRFSKSEKVNAFSFSPHAVLALRVPAGVKPLSSKEGASGCE